MLQDLIKLAIKKINAYGQEQYMITNNHKYHSNIEKEVVAKEREFKLSLPFENIAK